jgi:hypothetical protein
MYSRVYGLHTYLHYRGAELMEQELKLLIGIGMEGCKKL